MQNSAWKILKRSKGQSMVEYSLIVAFVSLASIVGVTMLGATVQASMTNYINIILAAI